MVFRDSIIFNAKSIEDYKKIIAYVDWYTQKTIRQGYKDFKRSSSIDIYARYLKAINSFSVDMDVMPKMDMFYLTEIIQEREKKLRKLFEEEIQSQINGEDVVREYESKGYYWDRIELED